MAEPRCFETGVTGSGRGIVDFETWECHGRSGDRGL